MMMVVVAKRLNDTAAEQTTRKQKRERRDNPGAHHCLLSVPMPIVIRQGWAVALLPTAMLCPTMALPLPLAHLPAMFPAAGATIVPISLLDCGRLHDPWRRGTGMARDRSHRSGCHQSKNREA